MSFHPYLAFTGNCREAFTRYQEIFGGELVVLTGADVPAEAAGDMSPDMSDMVLHAALVSGDELLMGADAPGGTFDGQNRGMCCNVSVDELAEAERVFAALSEGGEVQMPLSPPSSRPASGCASTASAPRGWWSPTTRTWPCPDPTFLRRVRTDEGRTRRKKRMARRAGQSVMKLITVSP